MDKPNREAGSSKPVASQQSEMEYKGSVVVRRAFIVIENGVAHIIDASPDVHPIKTSRRNRVLRFFINLISNIKRRFK